MQCLTFVSRWALITAYHLLLIFPRDISSLVCKSRVTWSDPRCCQNSLNLTNSLSKRLNSTTAFSTLMCPFGVGFMKGSDYLLSVPETRFLLNYFVMWSQCIGVADR